MLGHDMQWHAVLNRVGVNGDDGVDVGSIAAAHGDGDRQAGAARQASKHDLVAVAQAVDRQLQPPEPIAFVRIGAGKIEDEIRADAGSAPSVEVQRAALRGTPSSPVPSAAATSRSLTSLLNGKFFSPCIENVNTDGVAGEDRGGAVALVHVEIDDRDAAGVLVALQHARRPTATSLKTQKPSPRSANAWCVPPARLAATPSSSAARAAAMVAPTDRRERSTICGDHGKPMRRWMSGAHRAIGDGVDVAGVVNQPQIVPRRRRRFVQIVRRDDAFGEDALAQPRVLRHRELVSLRQRQHEVIGVKRSHAHDISRQITVTLWRVIHRIQTIDAHAAGEPLRLVIDGLPAPEGRTMLEKRAWAQKRLDHLRKSIMLEPRGHTDMYGALLTEPVIARRPTPASCSCTTKAGARCAATASSP